MTDLSDIYVKALNKRIIKESSDGWDDSVIQTLSDLLEKTDNLSYEINNCTQGSFTSCKTNNDLAEYLESLAREFENCASTIRELGDNE